MDTTNQYQITCSTCSTSYSLFEANCVNCNAKNDNSLYMYLNKKNTLSDYLWWFFLGLFSLPSILLYIAVAINLFFLALAINIPILAIFILPLQMIYYFFTGEVNYMLSDDIVNLVHQIGIENVYLTYLSLIALCIIGLIIAFIVLLIISQIVLFLVSIIFEKDMVSITEEEMLASSFFLIPLSHFIYKAIETKEKSINAAASYIVESNLIDEEYFKKDFKQIVYQYFSVKIEGKMDSIQYASRKLIRFKEVTQELQKNYLKDELDDEEILKKLEKQHLIPCKVTYYQNLKYYKNKILSDIKENKTLRPYFLPWKTESGYYRYFLSSSILINLIAYLIPIAFWYIIIFG